jgi:hypothetical protein
LELQREEKVMAPEKRVLAPEKEETPDHRAGRLTEELMALWLERVKSVGEPSPSAGVYNAAWSAAYEVLVRINKG